MSISSTVDSSEAEEYVKQQYVDLTTKFDQSSNILAESIPNIKFEESEGIHVGNVIYNIHHHSQVGKNGLKQRHDTDFSESAKTSTNSFDFEVTKSNHRFGLCSSRRKTCIILSLIAAIICVSAVITVSVYFVLKDEIETTTVGFTETTTSTPVTEPDIFEELIATRAEWGAGDINSTIIRTLSMPIKRIIIAHTRGEFCSNETSCISTVKSIQTEDPGLDDIPYNFLIGGDGKVYEGRGIEYQGQHTANLDATEYNSIGICVAFIGNYETILPDSAQIGLLIGMIEYYKRKELITDDHIIVLQDDLKYFPIKADALNAEIEKLEHFRPLYKIHRREEWEAQIRKGVPDKFNRTIDWILIGHTADIVCSSLNDCKHLARGLQTYSFSKGWSDILYNIFFGGDGYAFEGRGFDNWGSHHSGLNDDSIGVGVIGTYHSIPPKQAIIDAMFQVFNDSVALGKITEDYKIFGRSDFGGPGPGEAFMNVIKEWCRYGNRTDSC